MEDQSQKSEMRDALLGDRKRALERWRDEGRQPVFGPPIDESEPAEPEVGPEAEPEPEPHPEPIPEAASPTEPEPPDEPAAQPARGGWWRRVFARRRSA